jgi:hypothetical protein
MDTLFATLGSSDELQQALDQLRFCVRCQSQFTERDNIGRWRCTQFHPLASYATAHSNHYRCCNQRIPSRGCVAADHTDQLIYDVEPKLVDLALLNALGEQAIVQRTWQPIDATNYLVHRVDRNACADVCSFVGSKRRHNPLLLLPPMPNKLF